MKVNSKGAVTFSLLNEDDDLRNLIESLPNQVGSDLLRAIIRDGIEYQKLSIDEYRMSNLGILCKHRRMNLSEVIQPFFEETVVEDVSEPVFIPTTMKQTETKLIDANVQLDQMFEAVKEY